ncbi:MAG TPA: DUF1993 domain-containing protein [Candidatus Binatia bacterium]|nr:DUF1993 domain-containing protein [Candidatus Binatia bacterium]
MNAATTISQFSKMLDNLDHWLVKAVAFAEEKKVPPDVLAQSRLAIDQYELVRQVQSACDSAKFAAAYLAGQQPPSHADTEKTIDELRARIRTCRTYLASFDASAFAAAAERHVSPGWMQGKWARGDEYLTEFAVPNFYFHVTMAYAILRHNGVAIGKMDYVGSIPMRDA